ncbi:PfkB family carbohydrate kinase [Paracoccaceae bacterium]|nr:PfkB family carbohydrate kinase [Paracoccaceae bacterium]
MKSSRKKIYIFGCTMWDIVGKPAERISAGKDCSGIITERPGGVAFNVAMGLSKILTAQSFELNLVSAIGKNDKTKAICNSLSESLIKTKYLTIKGRHNDKYLSIETESGEIFGSINSSRVFLSNLNRIKENFSKICSIHEKNHDCATLIFDGNCPREFLDFVKKEAKEDIFTKYFIPANFSKLAEFKNDPEYFKGFNLFINLKEANILIGSEFFINSVDASKAIFKKTRTETNLVVVTDGPKVACGVTKKQIAKLKPSVIKDNLSRLGAGDAFFAYFLSYKEINPNASLTEILYVADKKTQEFLKNNDRKIFK